MDAASAAFLVVPMLTQNQIDQFHEQGFLLGSRILDDQQVHRLCREMHRVIDPDDPTRPQPVRVHNLSRNQGASLWQIINIWQASDAYRDLIRHPIVVQEISQLTRAAEVRVWHDQIQYKPAETGGMNMWHQDAPYWPILTPEIQVTAWFALDEVDEDNGCMSMVVGSHHWGNRIEFIHSFEGFEGLPATCDGKPVMPRLCPVPKGHVHYHHSLTWHASHQNRSGRSRRAFAIHYMPDETRYNAAGNHIMKEFVTVADGEKLEGEVFPLVWSNG